MPGHVEKAIRRNLSAGEKLDTPTGRASFELHSLNERGLVLSLGDSATLTPFSWACMEGVTDFLRGRGWVLIGASRAAENDPDTLDGYFKAHMARQTANYLAVVLTRAGVVQLDRSRPARVRLITQ